MSMEDAFQQNKNKSTKKVKNTKEIMSQETRKDKDDERTRLKK